MDLIYSMWELTDHVVCICEINPYVFFSPPGTDKDYW